MEFDWFGQCRRVLQEQQIRRLKRHHRSLEMWLDLVILPIAEDCCICVVEDITALKEAQREAQRAADVVRNIGEGLHIFCLEEIDDDASLRLVSANPAADHISGIPMEKAIALTIDDAFPHLRAEGLPGIFADVVRTGNSITLNDVAYADHAGMQTSHRIRAFPLPDACMGVAFEDITERKRLETEVHLLQKLDGVGRLAAGVAHELNTPLQFIGDNV